MLTKIAILATIGLVLSIYSYYVEKEVKEHQAQGDHEFKAACDISDRISCSKPFLSPYGSFFGITNSLVGAAFYIGILILALLGMKTAVFYAALAACGISIIFAGILVFKIKALCLVCLSIYIINALLLWASW